jgi:hypothetical protein
MAERRTDFITYFRPSATESNSQDWWSSTNLVFCFGDALQLHISVLDVLYFIYCVASDAMNLIVIEAQVDAPQHYCWMFRSDHDLDLKGKKKHSSTLYIFNPHFFLSN